jgi:hypothetical protein
MRGPSCQSNNARDDTRVVPTRKRLAVMSPQPSPIALTDSQLSSIMGYAQPLQPADRIIFLELVAQRLRGERELGDGIVARVCRELQRELYDYPLKAGSPPQHFNGRKYRDR